MALQPLEGVLRHLGDVQRPPGQRSLEFQRILQRWSDIAGAALERHTRPHRLDRQILKVATSSAGWAQNLQFERHHLRQKIEDHLNIVLKDIQFSTAFWKLPVPQGYDFASEQEQRIWQEHPSRVEMPLEPPLPPIANPPLSTLNPQQWKTPKPENLKRGQRVQSDRSREFDSATAAPPALKFERWFLACQTRDRGLPRCPRCASPTPAGELQRWRVCSFCISQQWQTL